MERRKRRTRQSDVAPQRIRIPFSEWPVADRTAWDAACRGGSILQAGGKGAKWRPASRDAVMGNYGLWLGFLKLNGWLHQADAPAERVDRERVRAFINYLMQDRAPVTVASTMAKLIMALNAMFPTIDWEWMRAARANLQQMAVPLRSKAERVEDSRELARLGLDLMTEAEAMVEINPRQAADRYRDGLIIALLALRPFRRRNFHGIEIGRHLLRSGDMSRFVFPAEETKGGREIEKSFPAILQPALERYLTVHRPRLLAQQSRCLAADRPEAPRRLWISKHGNPLSISNFCGHIGRHTQQRFGWAMDPQSFRICLATTLGKDDPKAVLMGMFLLDHAYFATTNGFYIVSQAEAAHQLYEALLEAHRKAAAKRLVTGEWQDPRAGRKKEWSP